MDKLGFLLIMVALSLLTLIVGYVVFEKGIKLTDDLKLVVDKLLTYEYKVCVEHRESRIADYRYILAKSAEDARFKALLQFGYMYKVTKVERV